MSKIIAILNQKGGVGKTTTTINLGASLASSGNRVLVVDLDPQGNLSKVASGGELRFTPNVMDLFTRSNNVNIQDMIMNVPNCQNLSFIPTDIRLSRVIETGLTLSFREVRLSNHLETIKEQFDFIILDCPPNLSLTTINAIVAANLFLMPINSGVFALDGLEDLLDALNEINPQNSPHYFAFRNDVALQNKVINGAIDEDLQQISQGKILKSTIRRSEHIGQASFMSIPLMQYKKTSNAINDYNNLAEEVCNILKGM